jgi:hypothetical protein
MNSLAAESVSWPLATGAHLHLRGAEGRDRAYKAAAFDLVMVETAGIGQSDTEIGTWSTCRCMS